MPIGIFILNCVLLDGIYFISSEYLLIVDAFLDMMKNGTKSSWGVNMAVKSFPN